MKERQKALKSRMIHFQPESFVSVQLKPEIRADASFVCCFVFQSSLRLECAVFVGFALPPACVVSTALILTNVVPENAMTFARKKRKIMNSPNEIARVCFCFFSSLHFSAHRRGDENSEACVSMQERNERFSRAKMLIGARPPDRCKHHALSLRREKLFFPRIFLVATNDRLLNRLIVVVDVGKNLRRQKAIKRK